MRHEVIFVRAPRAFFRQWHCTRRHDPRCAHLTVQKARLAVLAHTFEQGLAHVPRFQPQFGRNANDFFLRDLFVDVVINRSELRRPAYYGRQITS